MADDFEAQIEERVTALAAEIALKRETVERLRKEITLAQKTQTALVEAQAAFRRHISRAVGVVALPQRQRQGTQSSAVLWAIEWGRKHGGEFGPTDILTDAKAEGINVKAVESALRRQLDFERVGYGRYRLRDEAA